LFAQNAKKETTTQTRTRKTTQTEWKLKNIVQDAKSTQFTKKANNYFREIIYGTT
jgi:hypothetical protein